MWVQLNPPAQYEAGGTQFMSLAGQPVFRPEAEGAAVMFSGMNRHRGVSTQAMRPLPVSYGCNLTDCLRLQVAVGKGVRYVLAGFLEMTTTSAAGEVSDPRLAAAELSSWWHAKQKDAETWMDPELALLLPGAGVSAGRGSRSKFGGGCDFGGSGGFGDAPAE